MTGAGPDGELVPLERRVLRLWRIRLGLGLSPVVLVVTVIAAVGGGPVVGSAVFVVLAAVVVGGGWWWTAMVWRAWRFRVAPHALELRHGVLVRRESTIPFHRVQHIDTEAGPLERWLGLTTLVLRTASASSDATVPGIDARHADELRSRILALVGTGDAT